MIARFPIVRIVNNLLFLMRLFSSTVKAVANFEASPKSFSAAFLAFPAGRAMRARSNGWRWDGMLRAASWWWEDLNFESWERI